MFLKRNLEGFMETAIDYKNEAARHEQARIDSIESCDTDGFVSQWAHGINGNLARCKASIIENGGRDNFAGLYQGDRRVAAKLIQTKFGYCWLLRDDEVELIEARGKPFLPCGNDSRVLKNLGLAERRELDKAWATIKGSGTGLAGASSCYVAVFRTGDEWGESAELIKGE
jgi:hypothetical protein